MILVSEFANGTEMGSSAAPYGSFSFKFMAPEVFFADRILVTASISSAGIATVPGIGWS